MIEDDRRVTHESYGFIRASRVQGHADLFDSGVTHQNFVSITVGESDQERRLGRTWNFARRELLTVDLSEHQFAQFITSMNTGSGSPCTIRRFNGQRREPPPADLNDRRMYEPEMKAETQKVAQLLAAADVALTGLVAKGKASKSELSTALGLLHNAKAQIVSTLPFILKQFADHMEEMTNRAKSDLSAHAAVLGLQTPRQLGADNESPSSLKEIDSEPT